MSSSIGKRLVLTSFGESHGKCIGTVLDGCPAGLKLDERDLHLCSTGDDQDSLQLLREKRGMAESRIFQRQNDLHPLQCIKSYRV